MKTIWETLPKPIFSLAPMEDVTDTVFRRIVISCGRPAVFFTEFTNVEGMFSKGQKHVTQRLQFTKEERPLIAQIWGLTPQHYFNAAQELVERGFDGIDINMGCPEKNVVSKGACSALINNHDLAKEIILATREGVQGKIPVSVKTRIGFNQIATQDWIGFLLDFDLPVLTVHGRTVKEMSKVPAHWDEIGKVVALRNQKKKQTLIFGNGDVNSLEEAKEKVTQYGVDGVMMGRGIFHNPWLFNPNRVFERITLQQRLQLLLDHVTLFEETWGKEKNYETLKKYFKIYLSGFDGAQEMRTKFMQTKNVAQAKEITNTYLPV